MGSVFGTVYVGQVRETPIGDLWLACSERGLVAVEWGDKKAKLLKYLEKGLKAEVEENPRRLALVASELREYLDGRRKRFGIQIDWSGMNAFQREVLLATFAIPYGQTTT